ncbi:hypothetical protein ZWY2020_031838 [Hordeum vulgare]|nr:hypothetical protein ZWY2020_031838 [Hordeum vulgare]
MRITLGMSLEAWVTTDAVAPPMAMGAWRAGEVVWGNGHSYVMRWFDGGPDSGRILRKFVRPLPDPAVQLPADLGAGDNVEVLDGSLWKWAEVVAAAADGHGGLFEVKIVGSSQVLTAERGALRPRQVYGEKGWVVLHKGNKIPAESVVPSRPIAGKNINGKATNGGSKFGAAPHAAVMLGKSTKRSSCTVTVDAGLVRDAKRSQCYGDANPCYLMKKRPQCDLVGGAARDSSSDSDDDSSSTSSKSDSSSSADSSDDSSSTNGSSSNGGGVRAAVPTAGEQCQENRQASPPNSEGEGQDSNDDGRASASATMQHRLAPADEEEAVTMKRNRQAEEGEHGHGVHGLELEAYVSVMKAFHATGPLSWAKEELLTGLRLQLHVSGDEHLQVIRRLNGNNKTRKRLLD